MKTQNPTLSLTAKLLDRLRSYAAKFKNSLLSSPRLSLGIMLIMMVSSAVFCFTVNRHPRAKSENYYANLNLSMPSEAKVNADALMEIISLQAELKTFLDKKIPSVQDSLRMEGLLGRIWVLNQKLKEHEKN